MAATVSWDGLRELAGFRAEKGCAISVYVDLDPSVAPTAGDAASRVNSLIHEGEIQAETAQELTHGQRESLRNDLGRIRDFFTRDFDYFDAQLCHQHSGRSGDRVCRRFNPGDKRGL